MEKEKIQQKIDIYCIFRDVLRDLWVAVIIGISIAFIAYIGGKLSYQASYTSQTTFVVSAKENGVGAYENMSKTQKLTEIFQSVMDSQVLKKKVSEKLKLNGFPGTIDIAVVPETNLLTVSVTSDTPDMAFRLLKAMLECYPEIGEKVLGEVVLEVFEEPGYPFVANQYFYGEAIMKRAFMLGFICMIGILAIASCMKDTVKNEQDVSQKLDTTVFGVLQHERKYRNLKDFLRRKKKKIFVTEPTLSFGYVETIKRIRTKLLYQTEKSGAKVILVTSAMPGEGKTTVAMNLAQVLSQRSKKVLLIEGNLRVPGLAHRMRLEGEKLPSWGQFLGQVQSFGMQLFSRKAMDIR